MTTNLNFHAHNAIQRITDDVRDALVEYWRGNTRAADVSASMKELRAQSRATRKIAPTEADALLGAAALVEIRLSASERARAEDDIDRSDDHVREALNIVSMLRDTLRR